MTEPEGINHLLILAAAAAEGKPVPAPVGAWLVAGVDQWMEDGGSLERALGLTGERGARSARRRFLTMRRDSHLRRAWELVTLEPVTDWKRSQLLAAAVAAFEGRIWPRFRHGDEPQAEARLGTFRQELLAAFRLQDQLTPDGLLGEDLEWRTGIPTSLRALHDIARGVAPSRRAGAV